MRKIEQEMVNALIAGKNFAKANIGIQKQTFQRNEGGPYSVSYVTYHNSPIAEYRHVTDHESASLVILDSGYRTASTKSHQNALLSGLNIPYSIGAKNFDWFIFGNDGSKSLFQERNAFVDRRLVLAKAGV